MYWMCIFCVCFQLHQSSYETVFPSMMRTFKFTRCRIETVFTGCVPVLICLFLFIYLFNNCLCILCCCATSLLCQFTSIKHIAEVNMRIIQVSLHVDAIVQWNFSYWIFSFFWIFFLKLQDSFHLYDTKRIIFSHAYPL